MKTKLADIMSQTIEAYSLLEPNESIAVAFSGGKDSTVMTALLRDLGFNPIGISIDMGYEKNYAEEIRRIGKEIGVDVNVIAARDVKRNKTFEPGEAVFIGNRLTDLDNIDISIGHTPCTYCYSTKIVAFSAALRGLGLDKIAFGHHFTDALSSLIKSSLMYYDSHENSSSYFDRNVFSQLVDNTFKNTVDLKNIISGHIQDRVSSTDEPPREFSNVLAHKIEIIRPLFSCFEVDVLSGSSSLGVQFQGSGCGHGATKETQTPREMVRAHLIRLEMDGALEFHHQMRDLLKSSIDNRGVNFFDARRSREELLGPLYKPTVSGIDKI